MVNFASVTEDIQKVNEKPSDISKIVDLLVNEKFKRRKTILENHLVSIITTLDVIAQIYEWDFLKQWVDNYAEWRTSGDGGIGRKDIVEMGKSALLEREKDRNNITDLLRHK